MENLENTRKAPDVDTDDDDDESSPISSTTRNRAERLGSIVVDPTAGERANDTKDDKHASVWQRLTKAAEKPADESAAETKSPATSEKAEQAVDLLDVDEKQYVEQQLVRASQESEEGSVPAPEDEAAQVAEAAVQSFRAKILEAHEDSDTALEETLHELDGELPASRVESTPQEFTDEAIIIASNESTQSRVESPTNVEEDNEPSAVPASGGSGSGASATSPLSSGPSGHGSGPVPPTGGGGGGPGGYNANPVAASNPNSSAANLASAPEYYYPHPAASALVGGIIGYLIGRRRGRIKTEKRLLPVQKKLEKQVAQLQYDLQTKETIIRTKAREQVRVQKELQHAVPRQEVVDTITNQQRPLAASRPERVDTQARVPAHEAQKLHDAGHKPERIGRVLIHAESQTTKRTETVGGRLTEKEVNSLNRVELLAVSEKIVIEGTTLRNVYESNLIGERGLRRLVQEYLRGSNMQRALKRELVEKEIDYERDPILRDRPHTQSAPTDASGGTPTLHTLLEKAGALPDENAQSDDFFNARAAHIKAEKQQKQQHRRVMDISLVSTIVILIAVIVLLITR